MDKNLYLMRLERIQTWIAAGIVIALFAGVYLLGNLASPRLWQGIWIAVCGAIWLRFLVVIMWREKLVDHSGDGPASHYPTQGSVGISDRGEEPGVLGDHLQRRIDARSISRD